MPSGVPLFSVEPHAPERGRRRDTATVCSGSCCCCCIYSLGSLVGAAAASTRWYNRDTDQYEPTATRTYWSVFGLAVLVLAGLAAIGGWSISVYILIMLMPFLQMGVSLMSLFVVLAQASDEQRSPCLRSLGRITVFSMLGGVAGFLALVAIGGALVIVVS